MTCARSSDIYDYALLSCSSGARLELSAEDDSITLVLAECPARPYSELIKLGIPGPSSLKLARPAALRPSPPSSMRVSPIGPSTATPTRGELLVQFETLSRKPRNVKRKNLGFSEKGRPTLAKVPRLGASSSSPSTPVQKPERAPSPTAEAYSLELIVPFSVCCEGEKSLGWICRTAVGGCAHYRLEFTNGER